ncbi:MAG: hypothetical protein QXE95_00970 [Candidatus Nitrosocaldus sp.]
MVIISIVSSLTRYIASCSSSSSSSSVSSNKSKSSNYYNANLL